jgi:hypothetical protein
MWKPLNDKKLPKIKNGYCLLVQDKLNIKIDFFMVASILNAYDNGPSVITNEWITYGGRTLQEVISNERSPEICTYKLIKL